tara:strand:+ start:407 stop:649 length:243 start_codon:yes stop_codon:yes gene_type:complete
MVNAIINISKEANQILNIVKAKHNFKDKSTAIDYVTKEYGEDILEPQLRPEYIKKLKKIKKEKGINFKSVDELKKHIEDA